MKVWVIKDGENLPLRSDIRLMRNGLLAEQLGAAGHSVTWWASTFSHQKKTLLFDADKIVKVTSNCNLRLLYCGQYQNNISLQRWLHHQRLANRLAEEFNRSELPNVIVCSLPTIETSYEAVRFAHNHNVPIIIDVIDLWPDVYVLKFPKLLRPFAQLVFAGAFRKTRYALANAHSLVAVSDGWLNWALKYAGRERRTNDRVLYLGYKKTRSVDKTESKVSHLLERLKEKKIIVYTGTFSSGYNMEIVVAAAKRLKDNRSIQFVIAGIGQSYDATLKLARGLSNITFTGWLDQSDLSLLLSHSYAGLLPWEFFRDGMPYKSFEYFAAGLPIISSCEGELETLIHQLHLGVHYHPGNVDALVRAVDSLVTDPDIQQRFADHALYAFEKKFDAQIIYQKYVSHIVQLDGFFGGNVER